MRIGPEMSSAELLATAAKLRMRLAKKYGDGALLPDLDMKPSLKRDEWMITPPLKKIFGPSAISPEVYEVAARPIVKAAMEGIHGTVFAYAVTSSGKTHTMHVKIASKDSSSAVIKGIQKSRVNATPGKDRIKAGNHDDSIRNADCIDELGEDCIHSVGRGDLFSNDTTATSLVKHELKNAWEKLAAQEILISSGV